MSGNPEPKDHVMVMVTVSTVLLGLTPVFLAIQKSQQVITDITILYILLIISFIFGFISIASGVDWFYKPSESKRKCARYFLIAQTMVFVFSSLLILIFNLFSN